MPKLADLYQCTGCLACVESCTYGALYSKWNEEGHLTYGINKEKCSECHLCEKRCPAINGFSYGYNDLAISTPYAAWTTDEELRRKSTSGGVFAALAKWAIQNGGVAIGASMERNEVKHIVISRIEEIQLLQGSKYAQSNTEGIYKKVSDYLRSDKIVLFSGLGCQVAGLLNYLPKNICKDNLYTVDLICGGVPSRALITKYIEQEKSNVREIAAFRNKSAYEFAVITHDGRNAKVSLSKRPLPLCGFYTELTNKYICYDCKYVGAHRLSDITIGDYWGDHEFEYQHLNGLSIAVVHSRKGKEIIKTAELSTHSVGWNDFLLHNPRMVYGRNDASKSRRRRNLALAIANMPYQQFLIDYANAATPRQPLFFIRKILFFLRQKIEINKRKNYVKQLLKKRQT